MFTPNNINTAENCLKMLKREVKKYSSKCEKCGQITADGIIVCASCAKELGNSLCPPRDKEPEVKE